MTWDEVLKEDLESKGFDRLAIQLCSTKQAAIMWQRLNHVNMKCDFQNNDDDEKDDFVLIGAQMMHYI